MKKKTLKKLNEYYQGGIAAAWRELGRKTDTIHWYYGIIQQRNQRIRYLERRVDDLLAHADAHNRQRGSIRKDAHDKAQRIAHLEGSIDNLHATLEEQLRRRKLCERERDRDRTRAVAIINGMKVHNPLSRLDMAWNDCCDDLRRALEREWDEETKPDCHCGKVYAVWETVSPYRRD